MLNDANERIDKIDDLLVTRDGKEPYAVLSIDGFLGMRTHLVVVRYDSLKFTPDNKIALPGGSKDRRSNTPKSDCPRGRRLLAMKPCWQVGDRVRRSDGSVSKSRPIGDNLLDGHCRGGPKRRPICCGTGGSSHSSV